MHRWSGLLTALLLDHPLCLACLAARVEMTESATSTAVAMIESALPLHRRSTVCGCCGVAQTVYFMERPSESAAEQ